MYKSTIKLCKAFVNMKYLKIGFFLLRISHFLLGKGERWKEEKGGSGV